LTRADEGAESPKMNPTQKQFSLNRAASKSKFLSVFSFESLVEDGGNKAAQLCVQATPALGLQDHSLLM
jgi:hypothetical protein